jgi:hypothetical protein
VHFAFHRKWVVVCTVSTCDYTTWLGERPYGWDGVWFSHSIAADYGTTLGNCRPVVHPSSRRRTEVRHSGEECPSHQSDLQLGVSVWSGRVAANQTGGGQELTLMLKTIVAMAQSVSPSRPEFARHSRVSARLVMPDRTDVVDQ